MHHVLQAPVAAVMLGNVVTNERIFMMNPLWWNQSMDLRSVINNFNSTVLVVGSPRCEHNVQTAGFKEERSFHI
jgi:hypothetical protein